MSELKPCPICSSDNLEEVDGTTFDGEKDVFVLCNNCEFGGLLSKWNNRPHENKIKAEAVRKAASSMVKKFAASGHADECKDEYMFLSAFADKIERGGL